MAAPNLADIDGPRQLAAWFTTGDTAGHTEEAHAILVAEYGPAEAERIWVHGSQMADQLGVWV